MAHYTALLVDDSPTMRQLIGVALGRLNNLTVIEADDGVDALKKLQTNKVDIMITDINMPMMDGLKLVSMVRKDAKHKEIPIVVLTAEDSAKDRQRASTLGPKAYYLTKPVRAAQIVQMVKELLNFD